MQINKLEISEMAERQIDARQIKNETNSIFVICLHLIFFPSKQKIWSRLYTELHARRPSAAQAEIFFPSLSVTGLTTEFRSQPSVDIWVLNQLFFSPSCVAVLRCGQNKTSMRDVLALICN